MKKRKRLVVWLGVLCSVAIVAGLVACAPQSASSQKTQSKATVETPAADEFGVVTADSWKDIYPDEYATYQANEANSPTSGKHNYLEMYPALKTMYKGYGFSKGYDEASSHLYSLESITSTPRITDKSLANCITCKTPQFTAMVNKEGEGVYAKPFAEMIAQFNEPISCYNCHENDPQSLTVGNKFFLTALGSDTSKVPEAAQVCGQCHNEYYFKGDTKATTNPYTGLAQMTPDAILAYYDAAGFKDWEHPDTGAAMIKVQHPEFETIYGGSQSRMAMQGYSCADCHMGTVKGQNGEYTSHEWKSPLENDELLKSTCSKCHADLKKEVSSWQAEEEQRVTAISQKIEQMINKIAEQKAAGTLAGDKLAQLQKIHRTAQFYWDFVMVENSEGAHNPELTKATLDKAEASVDEGLALL